jgi:phosphoglycerol transferase MdoB-like AlkP superfamily enzyme
MWLAVMTAFRLGSFVTFNHEQFSLRQAWPVFWLGLRFDLRVIASVLLGLIALGSLPWLNPFRSAGRRRAWLGGVAIWHLVLVVFYCGDFLHYRYLNQRLNATVLGFLEDARIAAGMAWQTYPIVWITLGIAAVVAVLGLAAARLHRWAAAPSAGSPRRAARVAWAAVATAGCVVGIFGRVGQYPLRWSDAFNLRNDASANLALNPFQSFFSSLSFRASGYEEARVREHYARLSEYLGIKAPDAGRLDFARREPGGPPRIGAAGGTPPNIVLVICESFSGYKSSMWGNPLDTTPFFAELSRQGVFFDNCFTPHIGTARGVWATITGLPDVEPRETASRNPALVDQHTIINDFTAHEKFYFLGGSTSWANIRGLLTNNIRDLRLYEEGSYESPRIDVWGISDKNLFLEANDVLRTQKKPFFAVIQTADNHRPYTIPKEDLDEFQKVALPAAELKRGGFESNDELNAFRYTDFAFRKFIETARKEEYFERTIFVFIGDHGIGGNAGTMFPPAWTEHNLTCYHVPLLFYAPGLLAPQRISSVASMVDLLPTVAGLVGIPYRNNGLGRDLLRQQERDGGRSNTAFVIDHNSRSIGVIRGSYYSHHHREIGRGEIVWANFAAAPPPAPPTPELAADYQTLAAGFYETARFLLRHNRKLPSHASSEPTD